MIIPYPTADEKHGIRAEEKHGTLYAPRYEFSQISKTDI